MSLQFAAEGRTWAGLPQPSWQSVIMARSSYWKAPVVSLRLVPRTWKLPRAADHSLLSWQGVHKSVMYSGALRCCTSNIMVHSLYWMRLDTGNQCSCLRSGDACRRGGALQSSLAAASWTRCRRFIVDSKRWWANHKSNLIIKSEIIQ